MNKIDSMHTSASSAIENISKKLNGIAPDILKNSPTSRIIKAIESYPVQSSYSYTDETTRSTVKSILSIHGEDAKRSYLRLLLLELIQANSAVVQRSKLPQEIIRLYFQNFDRITKDAVEDLPPPGFYHLDNDRFSKDFGVCALRIIPVGAQKVNLHKSPFGTLIRAGIRNIPAALSYAIKFKGMGMVFDMHTDSHDPALMADYNPEGWEKYYANVSTLLESRPDVAGLFGIGWLFDPVVSKISPRLAYLRDMVYATGGNVYPIGPTEGARASALATSPTRRKLYEEGTYIPTDFMAIWDRDAIIRWSKSRK